MLIILFSQTSVDWAKGKEKLVEEEPQDIQDHYVVDFAAGVDPMTALHKMLRNLSRELTKV